MLVNGTPWEVYTINDKYPVHVKREDLCCGNDITSPKFSKVRGVAIHIKSLEDEDGFPSIGVLDTYHSKAGRGVAWICARLRIPCYVFFPVYKSEAVGGVVEYGRVYSYPPDCDVREHQRAANEMGAYLIPLQAGRSSILYHQAKKILADITDGDGYMMPNALKLRETVSATATEVNLHTPDDLYDHGTWVISISSGTICAGVLSGLFDGEQCNPKIIAHMGYSRSEKSAREYMLSMAYLWPEEVDLEIVDEHYAYKDKVDNDWIPFPCNEYYDAKAFTWLADNIHKLEPPVVFWNIGD